MPAFSLDTNLDTCLLDASKQQLVSLGKPVAIERLAKKSRIRIGVLPYYFTDEKPKILTENEKSDYLQAAQLITNLSSGAITIEVKFLPSLNTENSQSSLINILKQGNRSWSDIENSTWGFVKKTILTADKSIDFSNLDSVVLEGNVLEQNYSGAEAMAFLRGSQGNVYTDWENEFFRSVKTSEGFIDNAVLLIGHKGVNTIAHELMHNFGLTDLYGSGSGPGLLSMMAVGSGLLNYEKAVLGWFPNSQFVCKEYRDFINENSVENVLVIDNFRQDSIFLLKQTEETAYIVEVINREGKSLLVVYLIEQNLRPPITVFYDPNIAFSNFDLSNPRNIGSSYSALDFDLLINNVRSNTAILNFVPKKLKNTVEANNLYKQSSLNKEAELKAKAEAELRAKAEAELRAKAEAELKAKTNVSKKETILCTRGKSIKKVTSVNPKCPAGFKRK